MENNIPDCILEGRLQNPHGSLGLQQLEEGRHLIRVWRPDAPCCVVQLQGRDVESICVHPKGLFEYPLTEPITPLDYKLPLSNGEYVHDPYAFSARLGPLDHHLLKKGLHYELYNLLGASLVTHEGVSGVHFALWAPNATGVSVIGDFNGFDERFHPMRFLEDTGVWELFVPSVLEYAVYQFVIWSKGGKKMIKTDPVGYYFRERPKTESIVFDVGRFIWSDASWMRKRAQMQQLDQPISIYEIHFGSWKWKEGRPFTYKEMAPELIAYCQSMHFTHVELMGICEHPLDESWGYQVTGYFGPTSRFGTPEEFQFFVNELHLAGIGVILDWVPAHFPEDNHSLAQFDGTFLYEHKDPRQGLHPEWNTHIFNYGRFEVSNFLIASALFWIEKMHVDGLRVDAVTSMLYLDYSRPKGAWIPNKLGSNINLEAVEFLKHLNSIIHTLHPGVLMIAEESSTFPKLTTAVEKGGVGFDLRWSLGWMHDTLDVFSSTEAQTRLGLLRAIASYIFEENNVLVLSHDEVVHEKKSLLEKQPGQEQKQFASLRQLYTWMATFPGKKLLFMGGEIGQRKEWDCKWTVDWHLLEHSLHRQLQRMVAELNRWYQSLPALHRGDCQPAGLEWLETESPLLCFLRKCPSQTLLCVHHFGITPLKNWLPSRFLPEQLRELFSSNGEEWGGDDIMGEKVCPILSPRTSKLFEVVIDQTGLSSAH